MNLSYDIDRSYDCVKIDTDNWLSDSKYGLLRHRMSGRTVTTCLTKVLDKNIDNKNSEANVVLKEGSLIILSSVMAEISRERAYKIEGKHYYDVPIRYIIGYFEDNTVDLEHLKLLYNNVLIKKIDLSATGILYTVNENSTVGEVIRVGANRFNIESAPQPMSVAVGDIVLVQDNMTTSISINGEEYLLLAEDSVVGIFPSKEDIDMDKVDFVNNSILLEEYIDESLMNSSILLTPNMNYEELDISDIFNRDLFKVVGIDENLKLHGLEKNNIIFTDRNLTFYVYFKKKKYFLVRGMNSIYGKLTRENK